MISHEDVLQLLEERDAAFGRKSTFDARTVRKNKFVPGMETTTAGGGVPLTTLRHQISRGRK